MAYQDAGLMENWIVGRININVVAPKSSDHNVGKMENWVVDRTLLNYAEADAAAPAGVSPIATIFTIAEGIEINPNRDFVVRM